MPGEVPHTFEQLLIEWLEFARVKFRLVLLQHEHTQTKKLLGNTAPRSSHQRRSQTGLLPSQEPCTMCNGYGHPSGLCPTTLALQQDNYFTENTIQEFRNQTIECCDICGGEHYEHHHDLGHLFLLQMPHTIATANRRRDTARSTRHFRQIFPTWTA